MNPAFISSCTCAWGVVTQSHQKMSCLHEPNPATTQACERNLGFRQGAERPIKDVLHLYTLIIIKLGNHIFFSCRSLSNPQVYKVLMTQFLLRPEGCFDAGYASCTGSSILIVATTLGGKLVGADWIDLDCVKDPQVPLIMRVAGSNSFFMIVSCVLGCCVVTAFLRSCLWFFAINKDGLRAVGIPARMAENSAGADFKLFEAPSVNQVLSVHPAQHINSSENASPFAKHTRSSHPYS